MAESAAPADRAELFRAATARRSRAAARPRSRACGRAMQSASPSEWRRRTRSRSGNSSATANSRASWTGQKTREASRMTELVIRGLDPRIHPSSQRPFRKRWIAGSSPAMTNGATTSPARKPPHDPSSPAFQPRNLPLGLFRSEIEARPDHRQRRRSHHRHRQRRPRRGAGQKQVSRPARTRRDSRQKRAACAGPYPDRPDRGRRAPNPATCWRSTFSTSSSGRTGATI